MRGIEMNTGTSTHCATIADDEYRELFGSDEEEADVSPLSPISSGPLIPHPRQKPAGLQLIRDFVSPEEQSKLLSSIAQHYPHLVDPIARRSNQAMYFAPRRSDGLPMWMSDVGQRFQAHFLDPCNRLTTLNQMILNAYAPGNGLMPHVDLRRFADGVAILSLRSTLVMDLYHPDALMEMPPEIRPGGSLFPAIDMHHLCSCAHNDRVLAIANADVVDYVRSLPSDSLLHWVLPGLWARVLLIPGSGLLIEGQARWEWFHGIREAHAEYWPLGPGGQNGEMRWIMFPREVRSSVTVRTVIPDSDDD